MNNQPSGPAATWPQLDAVEKASGGEFPYQYGLSGFGLHSQFALPELEPAGGVEFTHGVVEVSTGTVPALISGASRIHEGYLVGRSEALVTPTSDIRFHVKDGRRIVVGPSTGADPVELRSQLLGAAMTAIMFQSGLIPFHCGAVTISERAVVICGFSQRGKSSLSGFMASRGHRFLADDRVVIKTVTAGLEVWPGAPLLHLDDSAARQIHWPPEVASGQVRGATKNLYRTPFPARAEPCPLGAIVIMEWDDTLDAPRLARLSRFAALEELRGQINFEGFVGAMKLEKEALDLLARIVREVPVCTLRRPHGFHHMEAVEALLGDVAR